MLFVLFWRDSRRILQTDFPSFFLYLKELNVKNTQGCISPVRGRGTDSWQSGGAATLWPETVYAPLSAAERNHWLCWGAGGIKRKTHPLNMNTFKRLTVSRRERRSGRRINEWRRNTLLSGWRNQSRGVSVGKKKPMMHLCCPISPTTDLIGPIICCWASILNLLAEATLKGAATPEGLLAFIIALIDAGELKVKVQLIVKYQNMSN